MGLPDRSGLKYVSVGGVDDVLPQRNNEEPGFIICTCGNLRAGSHTKASSAGSEVMTLWFKMFSCWKYIDSRHLDSHSSLLNENYKSKWHRHYGRCRLCLGSKDPANGGEACNSSWASLCISTVIFRFCIFLGIINELILNCMRSYV